MNRTIRERLQEIRSTLENPGYYDHAIIIRLLDKLQADFDNEGVLDRVLEERRLPKK